ncbi:unnamed protein product, partial [Mesorhabditis belari]|uniref:Uncharacterized protein n=1 Tax=Mesorhabditis belari TaxID=2138241 RepID=A0AAF3J983_9BILA
MQRFILLVVVAAFCKHTCAALFETSPAVVSSETTEETQSSTALAPVSRAKRQCGGMGGCCAGMCSCGGMGQCGQVCCSPSPCSCMGQSGCSCAPLPSPCQCGQPGCAVCTTNTQLVAVQQTCCTCCRPVCTQACIQGGGCGCGCTRGGCGRKRRSLLAIAAEESSKVE